jgi:hypothetical protein
MNPLYYGGVLDEGGRPVEGMRTVTVRLWDMAIGGTAACTTTAPNTAFSGGRFRVALDAACAGSVRMNPNLWAEVQVEATTFPRSKLGAVPYALEAGRATAAAGALEARIAGLDSRPTPRQFVVADWTPATPGTNENFRIPCPSPLPTTATLYPVPGTPFSITFVAMSSALYRVHSVSTGGFKIVADPPQEEVFERNVSGGVGIDAVFRLIAGRTYTFRVAVQFGGGGCGGPTTVTAYYPMTAESWR